ncbi:GatB/YqeY domain-containing protein [Thermus sp. LT1-2-5]|uniref:GatB/YqeY domain-containing protein n=1 Tax=Thermus sp. LT1-2-5 TaxID=3026935 RepID=UPI0033653B44
MTIYEAIKETIKEAMKARDQKTLDFARVVKAELDRKGDGKPLPDAEAVKVLKALKEIALEQGNAFEAEFLDRFLPKEMSEEEIEAWIRENLDLSQFKIPLAAIGVVTKALGPKAPGEKVRRVIERLSS